MKTGNHAIRGSATVEAALTWLLVSTLLFASLAVQQQFLERLFEMHRFYLVHPFP